MKSKSNKLLVSLIISLAICTALIGIFFWTYYSFTNKSYSAFSNTLKDYTKQITEINNSAASLTTNQKIDTKKIIENLTVVRDDLLKIKSELKNSNPPEKFKKDYDYLYNGLDNNIKIYRQILAIVNRPDSTDTENAINALKEYRDNCINYYCLISDDNLKIILPSRCSKFIENVIYFANQAIIDRKAKEIITEQNIEFANTIEELSKRFSSIYKKRDNISYVYKIRIQNSNYDDLISLISEDIKLLQELRLDFSNVATPAAGIKVNQTFNTLLKNYDFYLQSFKHSLVNEKTQTLTGTADNEVLDLLYGGSNEKYDEVHTTWNEFVKIFAEFKNNEIQK